ncbi:hypothetical protein A6302_01995 [Methylobrevis pamukkalensis]|uniref:Uncharacterized protein n=1 Tax=Methylobrevis pamukkalensis TaxID=1439726 RepID=A0A1E3H333_9HYPH|nr:hypothetical protein A6302_01995 [Methylobrevis pamukkalensis]
MALILALLLRACALAPLRGLTGLDFCPGRAVAADVGALVREAADLERIARDKAADCAFRAEPTAPPEPAPEPVPELTPDPAPPPIEDEIDRRTEKLNRGDLEISLVWNSVADLDLRVDFDCPGTGPTSISFSVKGKVVCGGKLDHDRNGNPPVVIDPVEHVLWADEAAIPPGPMRIGVIHYKTNDDDRPVPFTVEVRRGENRQHFEGVASPDPTRPLLPVTTIDN